MKRAVASKLERSESTASNGHSSTDASGAPLIGAETIGSHLCERMRDLRRKKGWTLEQLSAACGVSRSMLSQIERNQANPTLGVAFRIAQAFGMSLGNLVDTPDATPSIEVIRQDDRTYHYRSGKDCRLRTLSPPHLENEVEFYEVALKEKAVLKSKPHFTGTREFLTIQQGSIKVTAGGDSTTLNRGDSAHYPADVPHAIENVGEGEALVILVELHRENGK